MLTSKFLLGLLQFLLITLAAPLEAEPDAPQVVIGSTKVFGVRNIGSDQDFFAGMSDHGLLCLSYCRIKLLRPRHSFRGTTGR
jgi:hypothetical protein